jgi:hypothetical protein
MLEPQYNGKNVKSLSDDELFEFLTKIRELRSNNACGRYQTLGASIDSTLDAIQEEYEIRMFKQLNQIDNKTINLGSVDDMDDMEL